MANQKLVVHCITGLATGGAERMLHKFLAVADHSRFRHRVVSLIDKGTLGPEIEALGVPVQALGLNPKLPNPLRILRLRNDLAAIKPDLILGWMYHGNVAASFAATRVPVMWNIRQSLYDIGRERLLTQWVIRAGRRLSGRACAIIYNSVTAARQHERFGYDASKTIVIPNGFDCDVFHPDPAAGPRLKSELGIPPQAALIGLVARLHPMKDHRGFLRAAAVLATQHSNAYFLVAGRDVDTSQELQADIRELNLTGRVFLRGEYRDIPPLLAGIDIVTCCSAYGEGFPNIVGEAMSCGVPCVVTDIGDSAMVIGNSGKVVLPGNPEAMASAWLALLEMGVDGRAALGRDARKRIQENFSLANVSRQYENTFTTRLNECVA